VEFLNFVSLTRIAFIRQLVWEGVYRVVFFGGVWRIPRYGEEYHTHFFFAVSYPFLLYGLMYIISLSKLPNTSLPYSMLYCVTFETSVSINLVPYPAGTAESAGLLLLYPDWEGFPSDEGYQSNSCASSHFHFQLGYYPRGLKYSTTKICSSGRPPSLVPPNILEWIAPRIRGYRGSADLVNSR